MSSQVMNNQQSVPSAVLPNQKKSQASQRPSILELKHKYESQSGMSPNTPKPKSPRKFNKSMVKQMASMFNSKISHIIRRDVDVKKYSPLVNELSPEAKPVSEVILAKPVPLPRTYFTKKKVPVPTPRSSVVPKTTGIIAEEIFTELTVKEKALLYTQFIEDMTKKNSTFFTSQLKQDDGTIETTYDEVIPEKQVSVKHLLEELEARYSLPKETFSPIAVQKKNSCRQLENLFFSWLGERHAQEVTQQEVSSTSEMDEEKQKSAIERLLEEAIAKLEIAEDSQNEEIPLAVKHYIVNGESVSPPNTLNENNDIPVTVSSIPLQPPLPLETSLESSTTSSTEMSIKNSETEESESGMCSLTKTTSEESQTESHHQLLSGPDQTTKSLRKKKLRRSLTWRKDSSLVETYPIPSTDSETDCGKDNNKPQALEQTPNQHENETLTDVSFVELDQTLMKEFNSPRKIKSAYTLTAFSPVPPNEKSSLSKIQPDFLAKPSELGTHLEDLMSFNGKSENAKSSPTLVDSFDQGFETGSNDVDSPIRPRHRPTVKRQNFNKLPLCYKAGTGSPRVSTDPKFKIETPACFSTPNKSHNQPGFNANRSNGQQTLSPILIPLKNLRRAIGEGEPRRSSLAMQVIREDQPLDMRDIQSPRKYNSTGAFCVNAPTRDKTTYMTALDTQKSSKFWIKTGDFSIGLDIFYTELERVKLLYEIFSQSSCDTKDLHFGIDDHKFSIHDTEDHNISKRWARKKENSHYWFSTGDLAIPFSGKLLASEKIHRLFQFIKGSVAETGVIRFGVDEVEFSSAPEFWLQSPKFSLDSNYSMLVGLQSGHSNGLEGRSKYAWPHTKPTPFSSFDASEFGSDDFGSIESGRLSLSPFGSNYFDLASLGAEDLMMPRNSEAMKIPESFYMDFENEPLDQLFEDEQVPQTQDARLPLEVPQMINSLQQQIRLPLEVPQMINSLQQQKQCLGSVQERLTSYNESAKLTSDALDALKGTPEYIEQLKGIISDISRVGCNDGFKDCSIDQLERYMFFLSRYADVCLSSCGNHLNTVLDALQEQRAVAV